jgi:N-acetylneuraminic acid mutarotase
VSDRLDVYDPDLDRWVSRAPLPISLSGYALVAFEGRLYVFGGWDGKRYVANTFRYDPGEDAWTEMSSMPTARGFAGAAVAGDRVYVMGGLDEQTTLAVNEEYRPNKDRNNEGAWIERTPLSPGRAKFGIASVADSIYVLGGVTSASGILPARYLIAGDLWQTFDYPGDGLWTGMGLAILDTHLYAVGGSSGTQVLSRNMAYKALFAVSIPEVP